MTPRSAYDPAHGALRRPRRGRRAGRVGGGDPPRPRRARACCSPTRPRFPRDKPCGGGVTGRALRHAPCDVSPVVEHVVDASWCGSGIAAASRAAARAPLIRMTQRRRLDAHLAEQAAAAGADFRDGAGRLASSSSAATASSARVGGARVRASYVVGADGANGVVARAAGLGEGICCGVALEGNVAWGDLDARAVRGHGLGRARRRARRLRLGVPEGRPREPRRRRLAGGGAAAARRTSRGSRGSTGSTRRRSRTCAATGCRCGGPGAAPRAGASSSSAMPPGSSTRSRATGSTRRSSPRGSRPRRSSRAASSSYEAALSAALDRHAHASWTAKRAVDRFPRACLWALRAPGVFDAVAGLLRGELAHPSEARGLARPPLARSRLARLGGRVALGEALPRPRSAGRACLTLHEQSIASRSACVPMNDVSMDLNAVLRHAVEAGASDVHLKVGQPPVLRFDGELAPVAEHAASGRGGPPGRPRPGDGLHAAAPGALRGDRRPRHRVRTARPSALPRERLPAARRDLVRVPRHPDEIPSYDDLRLPPGVGAARRASTAASCSSPARPARARRRRSRRCSTTSTRSAASTSSRSRTRSRSSTATRAASSTSARSGSTPESFGQALRRVLRQDPDVILIGELRDAETAQVALQAAESGHLVFSTLHTLDAAETIGRMVEFFPPEKQRQVVSIMAGVLRGVISQRLLPRIGGGRDARGRGDGQQRAHRGADPRAAHGGDLRGDRGGRVLPDADLLEGADRPRARRPRRPRDRRRTPRPTATTSSSRSTTRSRRARPRTRGRAAEDDERGAEEPARAGARPRGAGRQRLRLASS